MHGIIFAELQKYVTARLGAGAWDELLKQAGLGGTLFLPVQEYPDGHALALVATACRITGKEPGAILEDFGEFIVPDLVKTYGSLIKPEWKTLDLIENTEDTIHRVVRARNPGARPPSLKVERPRPNEVIITYSSARRMCALAKGIVKGIAKAYKERVTMLEPSCMLLGAPACRITVKLAS
jgi:hypothetical protein